MHRVFKLAMVIFVGVVTGAGATYQPVKSAEQTYPISYTSAWPHSSMLSIAPKAAAAPSNSGLRMAQNDCAAACNLPAQLEVRKCQAFGQLLGDDIYSTCMAQVQQGVGLCIQMCDSGASPGPGVVSPDQGAIVSRPLCDSFPDNPACRDHRPAGGVGYVAVPTVPK